MILLQRHQCWDDGARAPVDAEIALYIALTDLSASNQRQQLPKRTSSL
jgi:hypothetical protein